MFKTSKKYFLVNRKTMESLASAYEDLVLFTATARKTGRKMYRGRKIQKPSQAEIKRLNSQIKKIYTDFHNTERLLSKPVPRKDMTVVHNMLSGILW